MRNAAVSIGFIALIGITVGSFTAVGFIAGVKEGRTQSIVTFQDFPRIVFENAHQVRLEWPATMRDQQVKCVAIVNARIKQSTVAC